LSRTRRKLLIRF